VPTGEGAADRVILGRVATLGGDRGFGWARGVALRNGRVVAVGSRAGLRPWIGPATSLSRLPDDLAVVPGITDAHLHLVTAALAAEQLDLSSAADREQTLQLVRAADVRLRQSDGGAGWLLGHGWSMDRMGGWPTAADLEEAAPGRRIALWAHDHHARWMSMAALRAASIDTSTEPRSSGRIRLGPDGRPSGILHEGAATLVDGAIPLPTTDDVETAVTRYAAVLLGLGISGVHDPGQLTDDAASPVGPWLTAAMAERGRLPLRVATSVRETQLPRAIAWGMRTGRQVGGRHRDGWLKLFADGALGSRSAALLRPYEATDRGGDPVGGPAGMLVRSQEELAERATAAAGAGVGVQIHGIGDAAVRLALDVLEGLPRPTGGARHRVEHAQLVAPEDLSRFGAGGIAASVQPCHLLSDAHAARMAWGPRTGSAFPLRALDRASALLPFGTDAPVESPDPWRGMAAAVARRDPAWPAGEPDFHPEQALPVWRALRGACLDGPLSLGATDEGRLLPGFRADLLIVRGAGLTAPGHDGSVLAAIRPVATLLDGEPVVGADALDALA
jgi:predicted amidohydrolase YtcJ